jgi:cbb3-type cytochrome oxidase subunit 3
MKNEAHSKATRYKVEMKGYILEAVKGRDYTTWVAVVLFLLFFIGFVIYWFTRKKNRVTVDASTPGKFTLTYDGSKAVVEAERLANMFKA